MQTHQFQLPPNILGLQYTVYALPRHLLQVVPHNSESYVSIFYLSHKRNTINNYEL